MGKIYAVKNGRKIGLFDNWSDCEASVKGFKNAKYKSFSTIEDANRYLEEQEDIKSHLIAYTDGSYNDYKKIYGYGCVLILEGKIIAEYYGKGDNAEHLSMRNVAGEIMGVIKAISYALEHHYSKIEICYDYQGLEAWAKGQWKCNKPGTIAYKSFIDEASKQIEIQFTKVTAHTGVAYNEAADLLAKKAVGI